MATSTEFLQTQILHLDSIFQKACNQVLVLNNFLRELQTRYDRASRDNLRTYRYALRLRLCTVEALEILFTNMLQNKPVKLRRWKMR